MKKFVVVFVVGSLCAPMSEQSPLIVQPRAEESINFEATQPTCLFKEYTLQACAPCCSTAERRKETARTGATLTCMAGQVVFLAGGVIYLIPGTYPAELAIAQGMLVAGGLASCLGCVTQALIGQPTNECITLE